MLVGLAFASPAGNMNVGYGYVMPYTEYVDLRRLIKEARCYRVLLWMHVNP